MKANRLCLEIITLSSGVALALALTFAIAILGIAILASGQTPTAHTAPPPAARQQTYVGMVTCSRCLAKHSATIGATATDCAHACIRDGAKFALVDGDHTYFLEGDPAALKRVAGQRTTIVGARNGDTISVTSLATET